MVTPLRAANELDREGLERLVEHILSASVGGLFVLGTTGEAPSLEYRLRYELVERASEAVAGRVPLLVGVTDPSLGEAIQLTTWAKDCGATAVVAAPPYYFPIPQRNLTHYFLQLADRSSLPLFLYNMPACTHSHFEPATLVTLARHPRIIGLKDSSGDLDYFREALALRHERPDWTFLTGPEHLLAPSVALGGDGGVNGGANLCPHLFVELHEAARQNDSSRVALLQAAAERLGRIYTVGGQFAGVIQGLKAALAARGLVENLLAEPLLPLDDDQQAQVSRLLQELALTHALSADQLT
jgi:2-dehydro-3-deoxy-D-pentonate aldolase